MRTMIFVLIAALAACAGPATEPPATAGDYRYLDIPEDGALAAKASATHVCDVSMGGRSFRLSRTPCEQEVAAVDEEAEPQSD